MCLEYIKEEHIKRTTEEVEVFKLVNRILVRRNNAYVWRNFSLYNPQSRAGILLHTGNDEVKQFANVTHIKGTRKEYVIGKEYRSPMPKTPGMMAYATLDEAQIAVGGKFMAAKHVEILRCVIPKGSKIFVEFDLYDLQVICASRLIVKEKIHDVPQY